MMKLNIGCGGVIAPGWVNADNTGSGSVVHADLTEPLPWPDGEFDVIVANHVMQMIPYPSLDHAFAELHRVTAPGGVLRVLVPDIFAAMAAYDEGDISWFPDIVGHETSLAGRFCTYLTWYGTAATVFTRDWLRELLLRAGYAHVSSGGEFRWSAEARQLDSRLAESIVMEAQKS